MEKKVSPAKAAISYGIVYGVILIIEFVASYTLGLNSKDNAMAGVLMGLLNYLILPVLFITLACNHYKNKVNGGYITFGECIKAGVSVGVISALLSSVATSILYLAMPEVKEGILEQTRTSLAANPGMTSEALKQAMKMTEIFMEPYILIPITILVSAFFSLIFSLIIGAIVKKENPYANTAPDINNVGNE